MFRTEKSFPYFHYSRSSYLPIDWGGQFLREIVFQGTEISRLVPALCLR